MVYEFGGVFADLDLEALKPIDELVDQHHCFVGQESKASAVFNWGKDMVTSFALVSFVILSYQGYGTVPVYAHITSFYTLM